jgi:hypothetical protein
MDKSIALTLVSRIILNTDVLEETQDGIDIMILLAAARMVVMPTQFRRQISINQAQSFVWIKTTIWWILIQLLCVIPWGTRCLSV